MGAPASGARRFVVRDGKVTEYVSNQVGAPASGALGVCEEGVTLGRTSFQSSGCPSEWGPGSGFPRSLKKLSQFPIKWVPQRVGPAELFEANGFTPEVSNQVGAPASGAGGRIPAWLGRSMFPIKWVPQRVGPLSSLFRLAD